MPIHPKTIYTKTPKGVLEAKNAKLDRAQNRAFVAVDGKSTVTDLIKKADLAEKELHEILDQLHQAIHEQP